MEMIASANRYGVTLIAPLVNFAHLAVFMKEEYIRTEMFRCKGELAGMLDGDTDQSGHS
jgi:hypothetical protein